MLTEKKIWVISDTHFYHTNIIKYTGRPFHTVEEMNETLVKNWNELVSPIDTVIHCGDFSLGHKPEKACEIALRLNGLIVMTLGNHDPQKFTKAYAELKDSEGRHKICLAKYLNQTEEKYNVHFSHYPTDPVPPDYIPSRKTIHIHGHIHQHLTKNPYKINVSVEQTNYKPVLLAAILNNFDGTLNRSYLL